MFATALVDYDNVCKTVKPERGIDDVSINLEEFLLALSAYLAGLPTSVEAVTVRFYGGWTDRRGGLTDLGSWMLTQLPRFRTRLNRVRIRPTMVRSLAVLPDRELAGTYRPDLSPPHQKLVDGMLTVDTLYLASREEGLILIVSDDDDFVPAAIASVCSTSKGKDVVLVRRKKTLGDAPNDRLLSELNVKISLC